MSTTYFRAKNATKLSLATGAVSANIAATGSTKFFRVVSDRRFHIRIDNTGQSASNSDLFVPAECLECFRVEVGEDISVIKADGETDGNIWIVEQS